MKFSPLDDRVLVEPLEAEETTAGGIVLPDAAKEKPQRGKVVAVGPGRRLDDGSRAPMAVKKGDTVVFGSFGGSDVTLEGVDYKILRESEILAKVK
jgi:chaperonin GroES